MLPVTVPSYSLGPAMGLAVTALLWSWVAVYLSGMRPGLLFATYDNHDFA